MKKFLLLVAICFNANATPFYFYTGLGSSGSFERGLGDSVGEIGFGAEVYRTDNFGVDLEAGYTRMGYTNGEPYTILAANTQPTVPAAPTLVDEPKPIVIEFPGIDLPVIDLPIVVIDIPIAMPEPAPPPDPPVVVVVPDPPTVFDPPAVPEEPTVQLNSVRAQAAPLQAKTATPTIQNDLFSITISPKVKINDFIWLNFRFGADKKMTDGEIKHKTIDKESKTIQWNNGTHFSDDTVTYHVGVSGVFTWRKQLRAYVKGDWYDMNGSIQGKSFKTDDVIVVAGLRFLF